MKPNALHRFLLVRDDFYSDPEEVRRTALSMSFEPIEGITGYMTTRVYHPPNQAAPRTCARREDHALGR